MRLGILMVGAVLAAQAGWADLAAVQAIPVEVPGLPVLSRFAEVGGEAAAFGPLSAGAARLGGDVAAWWPVAAGDGVGLTLAAFGALAGAETGVGEAAPAYGTVAGTVAVERDAPACTALPLTVGLDAGGLGCPTLAAVTWLDLDPFLAPVDFWRDGPLGELRKAAGNGAADGDAAAEYWKRVNWAIERRDALGSRSKRGAARQ